MNYLINVIYSLGDLDKTNEQAAGQIRSSEEIERFLVEASCKLLFVYKVVKKRRERDEKTGTRSSRGSTAQKSRDEMVDDLEAKQELEASSRQDHQNRRTIVKSKLLFFNGVKELSRIVSKDIVLESQLFFFKQTPTILTDMNIARATLIGSSLSPLLSFAQLSVEGKLLSQLQTGEDQRCFSYFLGVLNEEVSHNAGPATPTTLEYLTFNSLEQELSCWKQKEMDCDTQNSEVCQVRNVFEPVELALYDLATPAELACQVLVRTLVEALTLLWEVHIEQYTLSRLISTFLLCCKVVKQRFIKLLSFSPAQLLGTEAGLYHKVFAPLYQVSKEWTAFISEWNNRGTPKQLCRFQHRAVQIEEEAFLICTQRMKVFIDMILSRRLEGLLDASSNRMWCKRLVGAFTACDSAMSLADFFFFKSTAVWNELEFTLKQINTQFLQLCRSKLSEVLKNSQFATQGKTSMEQYAFSQQVVAFSDLSSLIACEHLLPHLQRAMVCIEPLEEESGQYFDADPLGQGESIMKALSQDTANLVHLFQTLHIRQAFQRHTKHGTEGTGPVGSDVSKVSEHQLCVVRDRISHAFTHWCARVEKLFAQDDFHEVCKTGLLSFHEDGECCVNFPPSYAVIISSWKVLKELPRLISLATLPKRVERRLHCIEEALSLVTSLNKVASFTNNLETRTTSLHQEFLYKSLLEYEAAISTLEETQSLTLSKGDDSGTRKVLCSVREQCESMSAKIGLLNRLQEHIFDKLVFLLDHVTSLSFSQLKDALQELFSYLEFSVSHVPQLSSFLSSPFFRSQVLKVLNVWVLCNFSVDNGCSLVEKCFDYSRQREPLIRWEALAERAIGAILDWIIKICQLDVCGQQYVPTQFLQPCWGAVVDCFVNVFSKSITEHKTLSEIQLMCDLLYFTDNDLLCIMKQRCTSRKDYRSVFEAIEEKSQEFQVAGASSSSSLPEQMRIVFVDRLKACNQLAKACLSDQIQMDVEKLDSQFLEIETTLTIALTETSDLLAISRKIDSAEKLLLLVEHTLTRSEHNVSLLGKHQLNQPWKTEAENSLLGKVRSLRAEQGRVSNDFKAFVHLFKSRKDRGRELLVTKLSEVPDVLEQLHQKMLLISGTNDRYEPRSTLSRSLADVHTMVSADVGEMQSVFEMTIESVKHTVETAGFLEVEVSKSVTSAICKLEAKYDDYLASSKVFVTCFEAYAKFGESSWYNCRWHLKDIEISTRKQFKTLQGLGKLEWFHQAAFDLCETLIQVFPALALLEGSCFAAEHWELAFIRLGFKPHTDYNVLCLKDLMKYADVLQNSCVLIFLNDLSQRAAGEAKLRNSLREVGHFLRSTMFSVSFKPSGLMIYTNLTDLHEEANNCIVLVDSMKHSAYFSGFEDSSKRYEQELFRLDDLLARLESLQKKLLGLEPVYMNETVLTEASISTEPQERWNDLVKSCGEKSVLADKIQDQASVHHLTGLLDEIGRGIEDTHKKTAFLFQSKRRSFSRLYFLEDAYLLDLIGGGNGLAGTATHIGKVFSGVSQLLSDEKSTNKLTGVRCPSGEQLQLIEPIVVTDSFEVWLRQLSETLTSTLKDLMHKGLRFPNTGSVAESVSSFMRAGIPVQLLTLIEHIRFTHELQASVRNTSQEQMRRMLETLDSRKQALCELSRGGKSREVLICRALVLEVAKNSSLLIPFLEEASKKAQCASEETWLYHKLFKFSMAGDNDAGEVWCEVLNWRLPYGFELFGRVSSLVYTPLTEKCFLNLVNGLKSNSFVNLIGPAGTGKTETIKGLAYYFGQLIHVFNCGEEMTNHSFCRILLGLVSNQAWGCFDEFNRIRREQLSLITEELQQLQKVLSNELSAISLMGTQVHCERARRFFVFLTMNPASLHYRGRSMLPYNLKLLLRPFSMVVPNIEVICEVLLQAEGFSCAQEIARKLGKLFNVAKLFLSREKHYDFSLRALKPVIQSAGGMLQWDCQHSVATREEQMKVVVRSIVLNTCSRLTATDARTFHSLLRNMFGSDRFEIVALSKMEDALESLVKTDYHLQQVPALLKEKCVQLKEILAHKSGALVVGRSLVGKSFLIEVMADVYQALGHGVQCFRIVPKALSREELFGHLNEATNEFIDGVFPLILKKINQEASKKGKEEAHFWIVFDGDIDPEWVENLNSVLDDNRCLTLGNGARIDLTANTKILFETDSIKFLSPATVSRVGIVFVTEELLPPQSSFNCLLSNQIRDSKPTLGEALKCSMNSHLYEVFAMLVQQDNLLPPGMINRVCLQRSLTSASRSKQDPSETAQNVFNSVKSFFHPDSLHAVAGLIIEKLCIVSSPKKLIASAVGGFPKYRVQKKTGVVETPQVVDALNGINCCSPLGVGILLVGPKESGKSTIVQQFCASDPKYVLCQIACNPQIELDHVRSMIVERCSFVAHQLTEKLVPQNQTLLVIYLQNIHLLQLDEYESSNIYSLLFFLLGNHTLYVKGKREVKLENFLLFASCDSTTKLNMRLLSRFRVIFLQSVMMSQCEMIARASLQQASQRLIQGFTKLMSSLHKDDRLSSDVTTGLVFKLVRLLKCYDLSQGPELPLFYGLSSLLPRMCGIDLEERLSTLFRDLYSDFEKSTPRARYTSWIADNTDEERAGPPLQYVECNAFRTIARAKLEEFSVIRKQCRLILTPTIIDNANALERLLAQPSSLVFMIGAINHISLEVVRFVGYSSGFTIIAPFVSLTTSGRTLMLPNVKRAMSIASAENAKCLLLVRDHHLKHSSHLLRCLTSLLCEENAHILFDPTELVELVSTLPASQNDAMPLGEFWRRIRLNLRVVFVLHCAGTHVTRLSVDFSSLWNRGNYMDFRSCEKADWYIIGESVLAQYYSDSLSAQVTDSRSDSKGYVSFLVDAAVSLFEASSLKVRTGSQFINLLDVTLAFLRQKESESCDRLKLLRKGLSKLEEASVRAKDLADEANSSKKVLKDKQRAADLGMENVTKALSDLNVLRLDLSSKKVTLQEHEAACLQKKERVEQEVLEFKPFLEKAQKEVNGIKAEHLNEIKSLKMPPEPIFDVFSAVLLLQGISDNSWQNIKRFLSKRTVKEDILHFDCRKVGPHALSKVQVLLARRSESFEKSVISRVSVAAAPFAEWVKANVAYAKILQEVKPLLLEKEQAESDLHAAKLSINICESEIEAFEEEVKHNQASFKILTQEAARLEVSVASKEEILERARGLLVGLSEEQRRWEHQVKVLTKEVQLMGIHCLVAAVFFTQEPGAGSIIDALLSTAESQTIESVLPSLTTRSLESCYTRATSIDFLVTKTGQINWRTCGITPDSYSLQSLTRFFNVYRQHATLVLDRNTIFLSFIQHYYKGARESIEILNTATEQYAKRLELCVTFGKTLFIEDCTDIPPALISFIEKDVEIKGQEAVLVYGEKRIAWSPTFSLTFITRAANASMLSAQEAELLTVLDFSLRPDSLVAKIQSFSLGVVSPSSRKQLQESLLGEERLCSEIRTLELQLLNSLSHSTGNILDDSSVIVMLKELKTKANAAEASLQQSLELQKRLLGYEARCKDFAKTCADIFFALRDIGSRNELYRVCYARLCRVVEFVLRDMVTDQQAGISADSFRRRSAHVLRVAYQVFSHGCRKRDRLLLAFLLAFRTTYDAASADALHLFVDNGIKGPEGEQPLKGENPPSCVQLPEIYELGALQRCALLCQHRRCCRTVFEELEQNADFRKMMFSAFPETLLKTSTKTVPLHGASHLDLLLVIQALRPERLFQACVEYCLGVLQINSLSSTLAVSTLISTDFLHSGDSETLQGPVSNDPLLFIISEGLDPSPVLRQVCSKRPGHALEEISLKGHNMHEVFQLLDEASSAGKWLIIHNLHFAPSCTSALLQKLKSLEYAPGSRVFLSTEQCNTLNVALVEWCIKLVLEPPDGLANTLDQTCGYFSDLVEVPSRLSHLLPNICLLHSILFERTQHYPVGFADQYEIVVSDILAGRQILISLGPGELSEHKLDLLRGLYRTVVYGNHMNNLYDFQILVHFTSTLISVDQIRKEQALESKQESSGAGSPTMFSGAMKMINSAPESRVLEMAANFMHLKYDTSLKALFEDLKACSAHGVGVVDRGRHVTSSLLEQAITAIEHVNTWFDSVSGDHKLAPKATLKQAVQKDMQIAKAVLKTIVESLSDLTILSLEDSDAIKQGRTPFSWQLVWSGPRWYSSYIKAAICRCDYLRKLVLDGSAGQMPCVRLSGFFTPALVLGILQLQACERQGASFEEVTLVYDPTEQSKEEKSCFTLESLFVQGATIVGSTFTEPAESDAQFQQLRESSFYFTKETHDKKHVIIPVYQRAERNTLVYTFTASVPEEMRLFFVTAAVAFFVEVL